MNNCPTCGATVESTFEHVDLDNCPEEKDYGQWQDDFFGTGYRIIRRMKGHPDIIQIHRKANGSVQHFTYEETAREAAKKLNTKTP